MRLFYQEKMYDYKNKAEAERHAKKLRETGWFIKEQYEQDDGPYKWTVIYRKGAV